MTDMYALRNWLERLASADPNVVRYAARVIVWGRWFIVLVNVFLMAYRPSFWYPDDIEHLFLHVPLVVSNGLIHYRLLTNRPVTWRWMLALCALDIALISGHAMVRGGYDNLTYLAYYPALGAFAVVFNSFRLVVVWTTMTAIVYALVCVMGEAGLDLDAGQEKILVARLAVMYLIAVGISLIVRFERMWRQVAMDMEQSGQEPPLSNEVRIGLFSIAHNALANAFLHAEAERVEVRLDFEEGHVRLSISDDGVGLPQDYAERGRGFSGMETDAERMGGELTVESGGPEVGTRITCVVPLESVERED